MKKALLGMMVSLGFFLMFSLALARESIPLDGASPVPVEYALPYPGILPGHPLFFVKTLRDKLLLLLISNPIRRMEFHILLADKHLNMGMSLLNKNKPSLALESLAAAARYLKSAEKILFEIPAGTDTGNLKDRFEKSLAKHIEIAHQFETVSEINKQQVTEILETLSGVHQEYFQKK